MKIQDQNTQRQTVLMKYIIVAEEIAITLLSIYFLSLNSLGISFWIWILLFFSPDISMLGYLINTRVGAYSYNMFHHRAIGVAVAAVGYFAGIPLLLTIGILLFGHSSFDRMMGYGLKYADDFKHTHLGWLPQKQPVS